MKLYIKNMVCPRCIVSVEQLLRNMDMSYSSVSLGEVTLENTPGSEKEQKLATALKTLGFELLNDPASRLIEKIKSLLIKEVTGGIAEHFSIQKFLSAQILKDYSSLSKLFSSVEGITIEQFFILQKIEKAKELLIYDQLPLSEIAFFLGYSSSQHLSSQFKKITGMTPTQLKAIGGKARKPIDGF